MKEDTREAVGKSVPVFCCHRYTDLKKYPLFISPPPTEKLLWDMATHYPRQGPTAKSMNGGDKRLLRVDLDLQESITHLHPFQRQHAIELHRQQQQQQQLPSPQVQASLSTFTTCTVPASCRARSRFLNLRDSVKKSPTKSTAKVGGSSHAAGLPQIPWIPFSSSKVIQHS